MEITCTSQKCKASAGFTPMSVAFDDRGFMAICAYSGCWEGMGRIMRSGDHALLSGHGLRWSGTDRGTGDFMIALDRNTRVAVINGSGFAMPLLCEPGDPAARSK